MGDITREELQRIVENAVHNAVRQAMIDIRPVSKSDWYSIDDAIKYMSENGVTITKSTLYKLSSRKEIPAQKSGKHLRFSRSCLNQYMNSTKNRIDTSLIDAAQRISKNAGAKLKR